MEKQRWRKKCSKCEREFSTHSTNRTQCHNCKPKCNEIHHFDHNPEQGEVQFTRDEENSNGRT